MGEHKLYRDWPTVEADRNLGPTTYPEDPHGFLKSQPLAQVHPETGIGSDAGTVDAGLVIVSDGGDLNSVEQVGKADSDRGTPTWDQNPDADKLRGRK